MKLPASQHMKGLKQLSVEMYGYFKLHTSSTGNTMVTMLRRNQYTSESIDKFYCGYTVMIGNIHCSTDGIGSLHIDSSLDGARGG